MAERPYQPTRPSPVMPEPGATWVDWTIAGVSLTVCLALVVLIVVAI